MKTKGKVFSVLSTAALAGALLYPYASQATNVSGPMVETSVVEAHNHEQLYDVRNILNVVVPTDVQLKSANELIASIGNGVKIQWNTVFGTPSSISREKGYLTEEKEGDAETIARNWLKQHSALFGLTEIEIDTNLAVIRNYQMPGTGLQPVTFQQSFDGIESVFGGRVIVAVNKDGKILSITSNLTKSKNFINDFSLSSSEALSKVVELEDSTLSYTPSLLDQREGWDVFDGGGVLPAEQYVKKAVFAYAGNLQTTNFGKGGQEGDAIMGLVQAGAASGGEPTYTGRYNAYMFIMEFILKPRPW